MSRLSPTRHRSRLRRVKLVLLSILVVGALGSITVPRVYALFSTEESNPGSSIATGTLTMESLNGSSGASTTLSSRVGVTTLAANVPETTLSASVPATFASTTLSAAIVQTTLNGAITAAATSLVVTSDTGFPAAPFTAQIGSEQMLVTATGNPQNKTWTVTRGVNGTTAAAHASGVNVDPATITVTSDTNFPTSGNYTVLVDSEQMTVTGGQGTTTWTVTRGADGSTIATHASGATVTQDSITVGSASGFPASGNYTVQVDSEQMTVTAGQGTTVWVVTRGVNSTAAVAHSSGTPVDPLTISVSSAAAFPASAPFGIRVDNESMTVTNVSGTTWTVTRGASGTQTASHASGASVLQKTVGVSSASGFPSSGDYTILVDSEKLLVTGGQGTTTWTVTRAIDGTSAASHASGATVAPPATCKSINGTLNVNTSCDGILSWAPDTESYPGSPATTDVTIADTGSIGAADLSVWMPSCTRGVTSDAPFSTPTVSSFTGASTSGGHLVGGTTYYYEVTAVVGGSESVAGTEAVYTPPSGTSTNQITLNWAAVSGATGYKVYRSTTQGGEALLASPGNVTSYTDSSATSPSGSPPSGTGSGNPCATGTAQLYVQETNASGTATHCWYPSSAAGACSFSGTNDLGWMAQNANSLGSAVDLGTGPAALATRYFTIGVQFPTGAANALQGTTANFTLHWYART